MEHKLETQYLWLLEPQKPSDIKQYINISDSKTLNQFLNSLNVRVSWNHLECA